MGLSNMLKNADVDLGSATTVSDFMELKIEQVYPNPDQPRKTFNNIEELALTIKENGLLQPISVVKKDNGYMIVSGERRYKAHLHNKSKTIKAHIVDLNEHEVQELALIENIQRDDLTDFEKAKAIAKLWASGKYDKKQDLAKSIGKKASYISKCFGCLKLADEIKEDLEKNRNDVPLSILEEISRIKDTLVQTIVYEKYLNKEITRDDISTYRDKQKKSDTYEVFELDESEDFTGENEEKQKFVLDAIPGFDCRCLSSENLGAFHIYGSVMDTLFKKDKKYKITIEEVEEEKPKEIKLIEVFDSNVYIEFTDNDSMTISHTPAKSFIRKMKQKKIKYTICGTTQKAYDFVNNMPHRTQQDNYLVLKEK